MERIKGRSYEPIMIKLYYVRCLKINMTILMKKKAEVENMRKARKEDHSWEKLI